VAKKRTQLGAAVGVAEHGNSAELVTVAPNGALLDRRRIDLTQGLPTHPYHHEGSWAVGRYANSSWSRPISLLDVPITSIAIRVCPKLPVTTEERIVDTRAANVADSVMYREALATAAEARGWSVHWYDRERVFRDAATVLGKKDIDAYLNAMGKAVGPPWQARHKLAAAAAIAATKTPSRNRH
jgi:hypothetical protein